MPPSPAPFESHPQPASAPHPTDDSRIATPESARLQPGRPHRIALGRLAFRMMHAIELNHQLVREANKVNDVGTDRRLASKLVSSELLTPKRPP